MDHAAGDRGYRGRGADRGAADFLAGIPAGRWAIITSASRALAEARLARAGIQAPPVLVSSDDVERGKPDPSPFLLGAERLGVAAARCLVLENTAAGLAGARAAGAAGLAITATHRHPIGVDVPAIRDYRGLAVTDGPEGLAIAPSPALRTGLWPRPR